MNVLGLRASPKEVTFCVFNTEFNEVINVEEIKIPNALETPEKLKYVRATILDVLREFKIVAAGIRLTEFNAKSPNFERIQIEGVLQESFASSTLSFYYQGALGTICSGQIKLATVLEFSQYNCSDFSGVKPPLY